MAGNVFDQFDPAPQAAPTAEPPAATPPQGGNPFADLIPAPAAPTPRPGGLSDEQVFGPSSSFPSIDTPAKLFADPGSASILFGAGALLVVLAVGALWALRGRRRRSAPALAVAPRNSVTGRDLIRLCWPYVGLPILVGIGAAYIAGSVHASWGGRLGGRFGIDEDAFGVGSGLLCLAWLLYRRHRSPGRI